MLIIPCICLYFSFFPRLKGYQSPEAIHNQLGDLTSKYGGVGSESVPASVAQLDCPSDWRPGGRGFNPRRGRQHSFVEIDHEIFSAVILSLPLLQEGQLSVSGERMCTILVNRLED